MKLKKTTTNGLCETVTRVLLTGPLVKHIVEGAIGHPVCNYDWMRGRWRLTRPQHGQHVGVGEDSTTGETPRWRGTHEHTETTDH